MRANLNTAGVNAGGDGSQSAKSSALAIAAVTAVLKSMLENGLVDRGVTASLGSDIVVSALPPDRITTGADERAQLNLFFYQMTPHTGLRAASPRPPVDAGEHPATPALAFDLHYLLTAYGAQDFQTEILLGYAIQLLQQTPLLMRGAIQAALTTLSSSDGGRVVPPAQAALAASDLAERVEQIKVSQVFPNAEEQSKLWSALQARYRPSATYKVSMILLGSDL
jgi:hypothetical protein